MNRLERLLDLVHVLQTARAPVSLEALRELFPDYADGNADATRRKFERDKAELARIGRYYATESMLLLNPATGFYDADATPSFGSDTLFDHYARVIAGKASVELGDHSVF